MIKLPKSSKQEHVLREYGSSGEDVSVNAVIIPRNWWAIPSEGQSPEEGYCSPILRKDVRIPSIHLTHNYCIHIVGILSR